MIGRFFPALAARGRVEKAWFSHSSNLLQGQGLSFSLWKLEFSFLWENAGIEHLFLGSLSHKPNQQLSSTQPSAVLLSSIPFHFAGGPGTPVSTLSNQTQPSAELNIYLIQPNPTISWALFTLNLCRRTRGPSIYLIQPNATNSWVLFTLNFAAGPGSPVSTLSNQTQPSAELYYELCRRTRGPYPTKPNYQLTSIHLKLCRRAKDSNLCKCLSTKTSQSAERSVHYKPCSWT